MPPTTGCPVQDNKALQSYMRSLVFPESVEIMAREELPAEGETPNVEHSVQQRAAAIVACGGV